MLELKNATLKRGNKTLFQNATSTIYPGKRVGVTGANGAGKSSLFSLILGSLELDEGSYFLPEKLVIAHVAQEINDQHLTALNYVLAGDDELYNTLESLKKAEADSHTKDTSQEISALHAKLEEIHGYAGKSKAAKLLDGLGFSQQQFENLVSSFSGGWQMRLNLGRALMCRSDVLLLDEPTNHLDLDTVLWLEDYLKTYAGTLLLISHDRDFLDSVINQVLNISQSAVNIYNGNFSAYEKYRAEQFSLQQSAHEKQQKQIQHIQSFITRFKAKATKAKQAQSRVKALEKLELIAPAHVDSPFSFSFKSPDNNPHTLLRLEKVYAGYQDNVILQSVNLNLFAGDRIGILGANGAGKSTLIKLLSNDLKNSNGSIERDRKLNIGYFAQHQVAQLTAENSALQHMMLLDSKATEQQLRDYLGQYNFRNDMVSEKVRQFSGGEKARLVLAMIVYLKPNLLLLDEPTNHLDLDMRDALTLALQDFEGALVVVSHDRHLLRTICDQFILVHDKQVTPFDGDLEDYRQFIKNNNAETDPANQTSNGQSKKELRKQNADRRKQRQPMLNRVKKLETTIENTNQALFEIETQLADPDIYSNENKGKLADLYLKQNNFNSQLALDEDEWMTLSESLENE